MNKVVVITGGTSGIGLETAKALAAQGCTVYELSRRDRGAAPGIRHITADVTDEKQVNAAVAQIVNEAGRIDVLINNAGFGISGAIEFTDTAEAQRQFDVNFFGMVRMNHAVLPVMRAQGGGRIISMSSVAAPIAIPFQAYYSASKAAVRTYMLALASEVAPLHRDLRDHARRHRHGLYRRAAQKPRGRRRVLRAHQPQRRRDGARRADRHLLRRRGRVRGEKSPAEARARALHAGRKIQGVRISHAAAPHASDDLAGGADLRKIKAILLMLLPDKVPASSSGGAGMFFMPPACSGTFPDLPRHIF